MDTIHGELWFRVRSYSPNEEGMSINLEALCRCFEFGHRLQSRVHVAMHEYRLRQATG